ncbi:MAG TPA: serine hydrolase domain-containing protein [Rhizomicrobium sp.]|jgi:CubicO group peptidase (beta-lactamase class C family)|nr:serine hydrolase domain-containing protein [Rhizomicrobium sp.]
MDKNLASSGFDEAGLAAVGPMLEGVAGNGDLSGVVSLVWRKGEVVRLDTVGKRDVAGDLPMRRDTLFRIASMTKPVTSVAAMMLVEEGRIALGDPIAKWLPEFADMQVLKRADGPLDETYPSPRAITVEDLLTHRAGLAYGFTSIGPIGKAHEDKLGAVLDSPHAPDEWLKRLASLPLSYAPGERFHYSHATDVLGFLVGRAAGTSFRDFIMQRILTPLGMRDTDFYVPKEKRGRAAVVYQLDQATGTLDPVPFPQYDTPPAFTAGGGGLISTLDDYLSFARMLLNGGELDGTRYLKRETVELMRTNRLTPEQRRVPFLGLPLWAGMGFGLGLSVVMEPENHAWMGAASKGSFGWPGAFGTWWQADPAKDMILIFLIQNYTPLTPDMAGQAVTGARMGARMTCPLFQKIVYGALNDAGC